jgi:glutathione synthase/RimK-type ligase-like ATP-grasp enzyme/DNA uptake protein ComE-like DNA-binding protein
VSKKKLPKLGFLYLDYVLRFFDHSNFKGWPDKIESVVYHWKNDKERFIKEVKKKKIDVLIGNIPATAYETFKEIAKELPEVRFVPSIETQYSNKSKENVSKFCQKYDINHPHTEIFYDLNKGYEYIKNCNYPKIVKRSYGASNYGGYYVHKVDDYKEAKELFDKEKYVPMYIQDAVDLKFKGDIRVMLIGHKPVCAFWRFAGTGEWITNTSQGGTMSYDDVPMNALELAVKASKAAKAEYWACDIAIDASNDEATILECATAFAAFPYIRDWIGQYLMWDFSNGKFPKPHIPLYSWEELGKVDASLLRTMRHIGFSKYRASADGALYTNKKFKDEMELQKAEESSGDDIPEVDGLEFVPLKESELPKEVINEDSELKDIVENGIEVESKRDEISEESTKPSCISRISIKSATVTELLSLYSMDEVLATEILDFVSTKEYQVLEDLTKIESIDNQLLKIWADCVEY